MDNQVVGEAQILQTVTASTFASKFKSKKEVFLLLTIDAQAYLPSYPTVTI